MKNLFVRKMELMLCKTLIITFFSIIKVICFLITKLYFFPIIHYITNGWLLIITVRIKPGYNNWIHIVLEGHTTEQPSVNFHSFVNVWSRRRKGCRQKLMQVGTNSSDQSFSKFDQASTPSVRAIRHRLNHSSLGF